MDRRLNTPKNPHSIYGVKNHDKKPLQKNIFYLLQDGYMYMYIMYYSWFNMCLFMRIGI